MTRLTKILITGTALLILPLNLAYADGSTSTGSDVLNGQIDLQGSNAHINTTVTDAVGNVAGASQSVGNNVEIVTMDNTNVTNNQSVGNVAINADQNATVQNAGGTVTLSSQAVCNSADVSTDPHVASVYSNQQCYASDPSSLLNASVSNAGNDVSLSSTAVGNTFSEDTNAAYMPIQNYQLNNSNTSATVNSTVSNISGNVTVNATAIGNNAQIVHY